MKSLDQQDVITEIMAGKGLTLPAAARGLPAHRGTASSVNAATVFRWVVSGIKLPDGSRLKLEAARVGGRWLTSQAALTRFIERHTAALDDTPQAPASRTPGQRNRAADRASRELEKIGI